MDRHAVRQDLERVRSTFHRLLDRATDADLARRSDGTRWTNRQLLFHMLLGYLILRAPLRNLVRLISRLTTAAGRGWARLLNASTTLHDTPAGDR